MCKKALNKKHILLCDKQKILSKYLKTYLEKEGYNVYSIDRLENLEKLPESKNIDVIISDLNVKKLSEWNLINNYGDNVSVIIMSTDEIAEIKDKMSGFHPDGYLKKPFKVEELKDILYNL